MRKNYILDTNILIYDPQSIFSFEDNNLYVPIYVLEELDKLKSEQSLRGRNSREACRIIDELRCSGHLSQGVDINEGGKFIVYVPTERVIPKVAIDLNNMDNAILQSALDIKEKGPENTILVTMDVNLRIRADSLGLQTASYESASVDTDSLRRGYKEIEASDEDINNLFTKGLDIASDEIVDNTCIMLTAGPRTALCRFLKSQNKVVPLEVPREGVMGIKPRNKEQHFALDMLLDDEIKLMTLVGMAGTGKTLLAVAAGLQKVVLDGKYSRLVISRPVVPMGKDIGFLPGTLEEKMNPWMQPIFDNLELLLMTGGGKKKTGLTYNDLFEQDLIRVEPLTYIRGRSLPNQFIIIDESQNLTPHEVKTIITRCGEGTKIVLTGDPDQIDNPYMDKNNCGLSVAVEKLQDNPLVGHLTLSKGERSALANLAATQM